MRFQSRAGFSGRCDVFDLATVRDLRGFNPVLGFLAAATELLVGSNVGGVEFQSRAGFSGRCDARRQSHLRAPRMFQSRAGFSGRCDIVTVRIRDVVRAVSIPCWVFWPLRRPISHALYVLLVVSIPCWVFWPLRRVTSSSAPLPPPGFNPVLGFLAAATSAQKVRRASRHVSIPCWVFWPLRLTPATVSPRTRRCFNPVLGFLAAATGLASAIFEGIVRFQSRAGFSGRCDGLGRLDLVDDDPFQSRAGFSGRCDPALCLCGFQHVDGVSIPCWVFWPLRQGKNVSKKGLTAFQSRAGFSGRCDSLADERRRPRPAVSIPCWVFWPLRPPHAAV